MLHIPKAKVHLRRLYAGEAEFRDSEMVGDCGRPQEWDKQAVHRDLQDTENTQCTQCQKHRVF